MDLKVKNIDEYIKKKKKDDEYTHPLMFQKPYRAICVGSSNCGKTNWLIDLLTRGKTSYSSLYVYSKHIDQPKYKYLHKYVKKLEELLEKEKIKINIIKAWENTLDNLVECDQLDKKEDSIIIIDDFNTNLTKKEKEKIADLYCSCRHKKASIIFLGQCYHKIPREVRLNLSYLCLYNNNNKREKSLLKTELIDDLEDDEFNQMLNYVYKDKYNFLMVDNVNPKFKYRKNYDEILTNSNSESKDTL
jgi:hypothetical protein